MRTGQTYPAGPQSRPAQADGALFQSGCAPSPDEPIFGGQLRKAEPEFARVVLTLRKAQISGHVGIRVETQKDKKDYVAFFFREKGIDPELATELAEVR